MKSTFSLLLCLTCFTVFSQDTLKITAVGHGSVMFEYDGKIVHVDPSSREGDYSQLPDADIIAITHHHGDHYDPDAINEIKKENTVFIFTELVNGEGDFTSNVTVLGNGETTTVLDIDILAVPAYNYEEGETFHVKGQCNGYVFNFGDTKVYTAGDTEDVPEMADIDDLDIAFIPMNQPYTMTATQAANAAKMLNPRILHIYHHNQSFISDLMSMLSNETFEIRVGDGYFTEPKKKVETPADPLANDPSGKLNFYPNPVKRELNVSCAQPIMEMVLTDLTGKEVYRETPKIQSQVVNFEFLGLAKGLFLLQIQTTDQHHSQIIRYK